LLLLELLPDPEPLPDSEPLPDPELPQALLMLPEQDIEHASNGEDDDDECEEELPLPLPLPLPEPGLLAPDPE